MGDLVASLERRSKSSDTPMKVGVVDPEPTRYGHDLLLALQASPRQVCDVGLDQFSPG